MMTLFNKPLSSLDQVWRRTKSSLLPRYLTITGLTLAALVPAQTSAALEDQPNTPKEIALTLSKAVGFRILGLPLHAPYDVQLACLPFRVNQDFYQTSLYLLEQTQSRHPDRILGHRKAGIANLNLFTNLQTDNPVTKSINHSLHEVTFI